MIEIRLIIGAVVAVVLGTLAWRLPEHYREQGRVEVEQKYKEAEKAAIVTRNAEIERLKVEHENSNRLVVADYEGKLEVLNERYLAAKRDGLRMPKSACERPSSIAETQSASGDHEAESIRLPPRVEDGLFNIVRKADETREQLNACQAWIRKQGFFTQ